MNGEIVEVWGVGKECYGTDLMDDDYLCAIRNKSHFLDLSQRFLSPLSRAHNFLFNSN